MYITNQCIKSRELNQYDLLKIMINDDIGAEKYTATLTVINITYFLFWLRTITYFHYDIFNVQDTEIIKRGIISKLHQISYKFSKYP